MSRCPCPSRSRGRGTAGRPLLHRTAGERHPLHRRPGVWANPPQNTALWPRGPPVSGYPPASRASASIANRMPCILWASSDMARTIPEQAGCPSSPTSRAAFGSSAISGRADVRGEPISTGAPGKARPRAGTAPGRLAGGVVDGSGSMGLPHDGSVPPHPPRPMCWIPWFVRACVRTCACVRV